MTEWSGTIDESEDDAADRGKLFGIFNNDNSFYLVATLNASARTKAGWRFQNVEVPQGATINSAYFKPYFQTAEGDPIITVDITTRIYGVDEDDVDVWEDGTNNPKDATLTTEYVDWNTKDKVGLYQQAEIDVTDIVQEIIDRSGWTSGNALAFYTEHCTGAIGTRDLRFICYDGAWDMFYPGLVIDYTADEGTNLQLNISDSWKDVEAMKINIGDNWKNVSSAKINIGDVWKNVF